MDLWGTTFYVEEILFLLSNKMKKSKVEDYNLKSLNYMGKRHSEETTLPRFSVWDVALMPLMLAESVSKA